MAETVYLLCALTSISCAGLLLRSYRKSKSRLLLWSGIAFAFFAVNNGLLFVDLVLVPDMDLVLIRNLTALAGVCTLLFGLIWESAS